MELQEYYDDLVTQFHLIRDLEYVDDNSVDILQEAIEDIVRDMEKITSVYTQFAVVWDVNDLRRELGQLKRSYNLEKSVRSRKNSFIGIKKEVNTCSKSILSQLNEFFERNS